MHTVWLLECLFVLTTLIVSNAAKKIVCYYGTWAVYRPGDGKFEVENLDPSLCTHIIYTFIGLETDGRIKYLDSWNDLPHDNGKNGIGRFNELCKFNPGVKSMVAIGGWNEGSTKYSQMAKSPQSRAIFVRSVVEFLDKHGFDGFDVDWEYPAQRGGVPEDKYNYDLLIKELSQALHARGYILSAAVAATENSAKKSYNIREISKYLDFINLMAYDFHGSWESVTGFNAPLKRANYKNEVEAGLNVEASVQYWLSKGAPAEKLILGVPFYGRSFTLANPQNNGVGAPVQGPGSAGPYTREAGMLGYNEICVEFKQKPWTIIRHKEQRVPYAYLGNQWVGFDDIESISEKAKYIKQLGLGGAMVWSVETDDFQGHCGEKFGLLKILNRHLRDYNGPVIKQFPNSVPNPKPTFKVPREPSATPIISTINPKRKWKEVPPQSRSPRKQICRKPGYNRDADQSNVFYFCQKTYNGYQSSKFNCPNGLMFDESIQTCTWPN